MCSHKEGDFGTSMAIEDTKNGVRFSIECDDLAYFGVFHALPPPLHLARGVSEVVVLFGFYVLVGVGSTKVDPHQTYKV